MWLVSTLLLFRTDNFTLPLRAATVLACCGVGFLLISRFAHDYDHFWFGGEYGEGRIMYLIVGLIAVLAGMLCAAISWGVNRVVTPSAHHRDRRG